MLLPLLVAMLSHTRVLPSLARTKAEGSGKQGHFGRHVMLFVFGLFGPANAWSYPTFPPSIQSELYYTDAAKRAALFYVKETVMGPQIDRLSSRLPRRFPVGAKYVVEGYGGETGNLRVIARYVVLPGGRRINVPANLSQLASPAGPPHSGAILSDPRMAHHVR
jgi:hypothetical protein